MPTSHSFVFSAPISARRWTVSESPEVLHSSNVPGTSWASSAHFSCRASSLSIGWERYRELLFGGVEAWFVTMSVNISASSTAETASITPLSRATSALSRDAWSHATLFAFAFLAIPQFCFIPQTQENRALSFPHTQSHQELEGTFGCDGAARTTEVERHERRRPVFAEPVLVCETVGVAAHDAHVRIAHRAQHKEGLDAVGQARDDGSRVEDHLVVAPAG